MTEETEHKGFESNEVTRDYGFNGQYRYSLDEKGRVAIPAPFRRGVVAADDIDNFQLTVGFDNALFLFPYEYWREVVEKQINGLSITEPRARSFTRAIFSNAVTCKPDKQGRITIPPNLRRHARLDSEVVIAGVYNRLELWAAEIWDEYERLTLDRFEEVVEDFDIKF
jgi:MraZ protein